MIESTWISDALRLLGWGYVFLGMATLIAALTVPKKGLHKVAGALLVILAFSAVPIALVHKATYRSPEQKQEEQAARERAKHAMALFEAHCKNAGEKIYKVIDNVDGVLWMKWRDDYRNVADQFRLDDPYGQDCNGMGCMELMLRITKEASLNPELVRRRARGYRFIEANPDGKGYMRFTGALVWNPTWSPEAIEKEKADRAKLGQNVSQWVYVYKSEAVAIDKPSARYGVTWEDISTKEDREYWIAGSALKIIDLQTNELVAERVGYMIDRAQGSRDGARSPWLFAEYDACPAFDRVDGSSLSKASRTSGFIYRVLKPSRDE